MAETSPFPMNSPYRLAPSQLEFYAKNRFIKLKQVLSEEEVRFYNQLISAKVEELNVEKRPLNERDTYGKAFLQITNLWQRDEQIKQFVFSERLAAIAADLMGVDSVRLYHDQALFKEAGGGYTPWHADQYYWPLASDFSVTAWIPLQNTPLEMGALEFSAGSHQLSSGRDLAISDDSEEAINEALLKNRFKHVVEPFDIGEVSFHAGWTFHRASPNQTDQTRKVMCIIYLDGEMKLAEPANEHQQLDRDVWCPGIEVGEVINSPLNPILFKRP